MLFSNSAGDVTGYFPLAALLTFNPVSKGASGASLLGVIFYPGALYPFNRALTSHN